MHAVMTLIAIIIIIMNQLTEYLIKLNDEHYVRSGNRRLSTDSSDSQRRSKRADEHLVTTCAKSVQTAPDRGPQNPNTQSNAKPQPEPELEPEPESKRRRCHGLDAVDDRLLMITIGHAGDGGGGANGQR